MLFAALAFHLSDHDLEVPLTKLWMKDFEPDQIWCTTAETSIGHYYAQLLQEHVSMLT